MTACGRYLSLGYYEKADVATVVEYLKASGSVSNIALWGHSMGAATSLLYASGGGETLIRSVVLDSPFSSLEAVMAEVALSAKRKISGEGPLSWVPDGVVSLGVSAIRKSVMARANFDIRNVKL